MTKKPRYIFTLTTGHAGGTLLNLLLGASPGIFAAGESLRLTNLQKLDNFPIATQDFWNEVISDLPNGHSEIKHLISNRNSDIPLNFWKNWTDAIFRKAEGRVIADKSLSFPTIKEISEAQIVEPFFVHLVRDPRAVEYSFKKKYGFDAKQSLIWQRSNSIYDAFLSRKKNSLRVRYEDICKAPDVEMQYILDQIGDYFEMDLLQGYPDKISERNLSDSIFENQIFSGNRMRLSDNRDGKSIDQDIEYKNKLSNMNWIYTSLVCATGLKTYGYPMSRNKKSFDG